MTADKILTAAVLKRWLLERIETKARFADRVRGDGNEIGRVRLRVRQFSLHF